ncbi:hypothetical protein GCM10007036_23600 [Alsobacter metallidurans]|uniref:Uncharacterized protein n=1 Tax=Alsobacter metallidurans TaxID=340221 RepID=A0A917MHW6_9HYPH|nr:hypothetical protein [Alsobacter metallidurans]GGH20189.1 hypothetical protein GCM10007036_23600 [Alsobacter metallidurans]
MSTPLSKLDVPLEPLLPRLELQAAAADAVAGADNASAALLRLQAAGLNADAMRLVAHALPKREAVWWACMCARSVPDSALAPEDRDALECAETWVRKRQDDAARRAAWAAAQRTQFRSPEAWAAVAAFWSGGSMAPEGQPSVPPADHLTGVAVGGAVMMASVRGAPARADERFKRFLTSASDIAGGGAGRIAPEEI